MVKRELVEKVVRRYPQFSKKEAEMVVNEVFGCMAEALAKGERVELRGFGVFEVRQREARNGRNPRTGAAIAIAAKRVPFFKVGNELRKRVNGETA
ncbi:MAG: integration host factor subunit beta [Gammaproteobacteria bacterium]|nr:integration host factor subunit beta [Gammaproteobacteria bacterium]